MSKHQQTELSTSPQKTDFDSLSSDLKIKILQDSKIFFFDSPVTWDTFFKKNNLYKYGSNLDNTTTRYVIILTGKNSGEIRYLKTENNEIFYLSPYISTRDIKNDCFRYLDMNLINRPRTSLITHDTIVSLRIEKWNTLKNYHYSEIWKNYDGTNTDGFEVILDTTDIGWGEGRTETIGGSKAYVKKEICGKLRCIYKIPGSRKEYIKYKGHLITVSDYKNTKKKA
jgi:hypothetical protein